jgi:hypothetical protein
MQLVSHLARYRMALASLDTAGRRLVARLVAQIEANPDVGKLIDLVWAPWMNPSHFGGNVCGLRANRSDCARSLVILYRIEGDRVTLLDVVILPPIPPPQEPAL